MQLEAIERLFAPLHRTGMTTQIEIAVLAEKPDASSMPLAPVHQVGQRFIVVPELTPELELEFNPSKFISSPPPDRPHLIPLQLPATRAFGSGLHPTTVLSLQLLERYALPGVNALDFGSGSGILSVALAKLGATVLALDNDSVAVAATQEMAQLNRVEAQVTVTRGSLGTGSYLGHWMGGALADPVLAIDAPASFDLIAANIPARIHLALHENFRQALRPLGWLIVAGFTQDYETEIAAALTESRFTIFEQARLGEWVAFASRLER
jgi:ribosomal protein L11 methyltransferase